MSHPCHHHVLRLSVSTPSLRWMQPMACRRVHATSLALHWSAALMGSYGLYMVPWHVPCSGSSSRLAAEAKQPVRPLCRISNDGHVLAEESAGCGQSWSMHTPHNERLFTLRWQCRLCGCRQSQQNTPPSTLGPLMSIPPVHGLLQGTPPHCLEDILCSMCRAKHHSF